MEDIRTKLENTGYFIREKSRIVPKIGIILGSGLGKIAEKVEMDAVFNYSSLPNFVRPVTEGHKGELILGKLNGIETAVLSGRPHYYEGFSFEQIVYPVKVLKYLGIECLIITSAVGSLRKKFKKGDIVLIKDHINFMGGNPLIGQNAEKNEERFIDLSESYDKGLRKLAVAAGRRNGIKLREGNYFAVSGPVYETPAEVRAFSKMGGDIIGMSVVPEVLIARKLGLRVCAISYVSNLASGLQKGPITHKAVMDSSLAAGDKISGMISHLVRSIYSK